MTLPTGQERVEEAPILVAKKKDANDTIGVEDVEPDEDFDLAYEETFLPPKCSTSSRQKKNEAKKNFKRSHHKALHRD